MTWCVYGWLHVCLCVSVSVRIVCLLLLPVQSVLFDPQLNPLWFSLEAGLNTTVTLSHRVLCLHYCIRPCQTNQHNRHVSLALLRLLYTRVALLGRSKWTRCLDSLCTMAFHAWHANSEIDLVSVCLCRFSADTMGACHLPQQSALLHQVSATSGSISALWECMYLCFWLLHVCFSTKVKSDLDLFDIQCTPNSVCGVIKSYFCDWLAVFLASLFHIVTSQWRVRAVQNSLWCNPSHQKAGETIRSTSFIDLYWNELPFVFISLFSLTLYSC